MRRSNQKVSLLRIGGVGGNAFIILRARYLFYLDWLRVFYVVVFSFVYFQNIVNQRLKYFENGFEEKKAKPNLSP